MNKLILILGIGVMLAPISVIQAATASTTSAATTAPTIKEADKAKLEQLKANLIKETAILKDNLGSSKTDIESKIAQKRGEIKVKLTVKSQEKIRITLEKIYDKFNSQLGKLSQVDVKILSKITSIEKEKKDVTKAKAQYIVAKAALDKANADILAARMISVEQLTKETSKEVFKSLVKTSEESIKIAGSEYRKILPLIVTNQ